MRWARNYDGDLEAGSGHVGPSNMWTKIHLTPTRWIHQYIFETPIDEYHTRIFLVCMRNVLLTLDRRGILLRGSEGEPFANPRRRPCLEFIHDARAEILFEAEHDSLRTLPHLPEARL